MNDTSYDRTIDRWTRSALRELGALDRDEGVEAADRVDGLWWDSSRRVPDERLLLRRNFDLSLVVVPWTVERAGRGGPSDDGRDCSGAGPIPLVIADRLGDLSFAEFLSFRLRPDPPLAALLPTGAREISQMDFQEIVEEIRAAARTEFGPLADSPNP